MSNVSKVIYKQLNELFPNLYRIEALSKFSFKAHGFSDINLLMLQTDTDELNFILSHYSNDNGKLTPNPVIEIAFCPVNKTAEVVTYKSPDFSFKLIVQPDNVDSLARCQANKLLYEWLKKLKMWKWDRHCNIGFSM